MSHQLKSRISARAVWRTMAPRTRRFVRQTRATTTVEFGLLAAPFIALAFAILQTAIVFFASQALETAAATAGRLVLTGQAQTTGWTADQFKQQVCNAITGLFNLSERRLRRRRDLFVLRGGEPHHADQQRHLQQFGPGLQSRRPGRHRGGAALLQISGLHESARFNLSNLNGGYDLLAATAVFKNEPTDCEGRHDCPRHDRPLDECIDRPGFAVSAAGSATSPASAAASRARIRPAAADADHPVPRQRRGHHRRRHPAQGHLDGRARSPDLSSQFTSIANADMSNILNASGDISCPMRPPPAGGGVGAVDRRPRPGHRGFGAIRSTARRARSIGRQCSSSLATANTYLILGEAAYSLQSDLRLCHDGTVSLSDQIYMRPRNPARWRARIRSVLRHLIS